jgi:NTE family protein
VEVDGRLCIDGFLSDPMPVGVAIREGAGVILAVGFESPNQRRINSPARFAFQLSSIMTNTPVQVDVRVPSTRAPRRSDSDRAAVRQHVGLFDTAKIGYVIEEGERAAAEQVPYLRRLLGLGEPANRSDRPVRRRPMTASGSP